MAATTSCLMSMEAPDQGKPMAQAGAFVKPRVKPAVQ
jgi:hypothetical protein